MSNLTYKIRVFDDKTGSIALSLHRGDTEVGNISIDLPLNDSDQYPTGDELDTIIKAYIPYDYYNRIEKISGGISNASSISELVEAYPDVDVDGVLDDEQAFVASVVDILKTHSLIS